MATKQSLNDAELDNVVGGSYKQCIELADATNFSKDWGSDYFINNPKSIVGLIAYAYGCNSGDVRVVLKDSCDGNNEYYVNNKRIPHEEMLNKLRAKFCHQ